MKPDVELSAVLKSCPLIFIIYPGFVQVSGLPAVPFPESGAPETVTAVK